LSGLLHAIVFKHLGHNVSVLERSSRDSLQSQASGLNAGPEVRRMIDSYIKLDKRYARASNLVEVINIEGKIINSFPSDDTLYLTTWRVLYDIFKSHFLEAPEGGKGPLATYQTNKLVRSVQYDGEKVVVAYGDTLTEVSSILHADLVIAADGAHSLVRKTVLPNVQPEYAGYITWRGVVPEYSLSENSRKMLKDRNIFFKTGQGYILS
jgi:2-polyprenyl-6-methoxyphenol hydroxylase-like FAD-dependent oxidoreductase